MSVDDENIVVIASEMKLLVEAVWLCHGRKWWEISGCMVVLILEMNVGREEE